MDVYHNSTNTRNEVYAHNTNKIVYIYDDNILFGLRGYFSCLNIKVCLIILDSWLDNEDHPMDYITYPVQ